MSQPHIKITYWPFGGRTAMARLALAYKGIPVEFDGLDGARWAELSKDTKRFPTEDIPTMEVDGRVITESAAIAAYAGALSGLMPTDPQGIATYTEIMSLTEVVLTGFFGTCFYKTMEFANPGVPAEELKARSEGPYRETLFFYAKRVDEIVKLNAAVSDKHVVGTELSMADLAVWNVANLGKSHPNFLEKFDGIARIKAMVDSLEPNAEFVKLRTQFNE